MDSDGEFGDDVMSAITDVIQSQMQEYQEEMADDVSTKIKAIKDELLSQHQELKEDIQQDINKDREEASTTINETINRELEQLKEVFKQDIITLRQEMRQEVANTITDAIKRELERETYILTGHITSSRGLCQEATELAEKVCAPEQDPSLVVSPCTPSTSYVALPLGPTTSTPCVPEQDPSLVVSPCTPSTSYVAQPLGPTTSTPCVASTVEVLSSPVVLLDNTSDKQVLHRVTNVSKRSNVSSDEEDTMETTQRPRKKAKFNWKSHVEAAAFIRGFLQPEGFSRSVSTKNKCYREGVKRGIWPKKTEWQLRVFYKVDSLAKQALT